MGCKERGEAVNLAIRQLADYGVKKKLIAGEDRVFAINQFLMILGLDEYREPEESGEERPLHEILEVLARDACQRGIIDRDDVTTFDLFDTRLMGVLTDRPSHIADSFWRTYEKSPELATESFYRFSQDVNYIRRDRIKKDWKWTVDSPYGKIDITVNLSKPEKDPRAIAAAKSMKQSAYPRCQLCWENEGYAGRVNHPARENHRIIPIEITGQKWGFQYSPYVYYNEHCIVFNREHVPMKIDGEAFKKLFDFVRQFPHYFVGSNADLPIVGGSILAHEHFQGGHYCFAMERASVEKSFNIPGYEDVEAGIVHWPLAVIRIRHRNPDRLAALADHILQCWRDYTDEKAFIYASTDGNPHNTVTPIARMRDGVFELDLALRNNITTEEHPLGVYHPHEQRHHIKKENIGLIEVMGLAVLPSRLKREMELLASEMTAGEENRSIAAGAENRGEKNRRILARIAGHEELKKHEKWADGILKKYPDIDRDNVMDILQQEIGEVFIRVLEDAGVYKTDEEGRRAFERFIRIL